MVQNKMNEVAKLLGVELYEEFKVYGWDGFCKITELGLERYVKGKGLLMDPIMLIDLIKGTAKIIKLPKPILNEEEKEYLSNVIKPFRDNVIAIAKHPSYNNLSYIEISLKKYLFAESINLPYFENHKMYKNMKLDKVYTLEELGL